MICDCRQKMKVIRTIRIDNEKTFRVYLCPNCNKTSETTEMACATLKRDYTQKTKRWKV